MGGFFLTETGIQENDENLDTLDDYGLVKQKSKKKDIVKGEEFKISCEADTIYEILEALED
jgi:hypothetical protein